MRKRFCLLVCALAIAVIASSSALAIPSFRGYTGLVVIPTADALGQGAWNAGIFFEDVSSGTVNDIIANYGIAPGLEVGFDRFRWDDDSDAKTLINAKYAFLPETVGRPGVAAGVSDITDELEATVYVVGSKSLTSTLGTYNGEIITPRIHVGFGGGRFDGLFAGLSTYLGNRIQVMAEWDSRNVQVGGRFRFTPGLTVHVAGFNLTDRTNPDSSARDNASFGAGVSYAFSF